MSSTKVGFKNCLINDTQKGCLSRTDLVPASPQRCQCKQAREANQINTTFIKIYAPCSLSTELRAIKYITVINSSISKIIKYIADIKTIKLLKEKIRLHLQNWKYTNSKKMTNNKRLLVTICFANWNIKCSIIPQFSTFRPGWKQTS